MVVGWFRIGELVNKLLEWDETKTRGNAMSLGVGVYDDTMSQMCWCSKLHSPA